MKETKIKKNLFLMLLRSAAKGAISCLVALLLLSLLENLSLRKKAANKRKVFKAASKSHVSVEDKIAKWR